MASSVLPVAELVLNKLWPDVMYKQLADELLDTVVRSFGRRWLHGGLRPRFGYFADLYVTSTAVYIENNTQMIQCEHFNTGLKQSFLFHYH